jgi:diacylglycerol kinase family enzyme
MANSKQYGFGAHIAPAARFDDGLLDMITIEDRRFIGNMARVPSLFVGRLDHRKGVHATRLREAIIRSAGPMLFHVDGEAIQGSDTLAARVLPAALRLRA